MAQLDVFTLVVAVVVLVFCLIASVAVYLYHANPQENTSLFSKVVICVSLFLLLAEPSLSVMDVVDANRCKRDTTPLNPNYDFSGCTLPLEAMWFTLFFSNMLMIFLVFPFTLFYNQLFSKNAFWKRLLQSLSLSILVAGVVSTAYAFLRWVTPNETFGSRLLLSAGTPLKSNTSDSAFTAEQCSAVDTTVYGTNSPLNFVLFINVIIGGIFFSVWAGIGLVSHPWRMAMAFVRRPKVAISKSEFSRAAHLRDKRKVQGRVFFSIRDFLKLLKINRELAALEGDEEALLERFPQGDDPEATWTLQIIKLWIQMFFALFSAAVSCLYLVNMFYVAIYERPLPFLTLILNFVPTDSLDHNYAVSVGRTLALLIFNQHILFCTMSGQRLLQDITPLLSIHCMRHQKSLSSSMRSNLLGLIICLQPMLVFFVETLQEAYGSTVLAFLSSPTYGQARTFQQLVSVHPSLWLMISCSLLAAVAFPVSLLVKVYRERTSAATLQKVIQ